MTAVCLFHTEWERSMAVRWRGHPWTPGDNSPPALWRQAWAHSSASDWVFHSLVSKPSPSQRRSLRFLPRLLDSKICLDFEWTSLHQMAGILHKFPKPVTPLHPNNVFTAHPSIQMQAEHCAIIPYILYKVQGQCISILSKMHLSAFVWGVMFPPSLVTVIIKHVCFNGEQRSPSPRALTLGLMEKQQFHFTKYLQVLKFVFNLHRNKN